MSVPDRLSVLTLQPFYGGSHRQFIDGWIANSFHDWTILSLPARHWKWRMRHAAVEFAEQADAGWRQGERWDVVLCTDMMNVAEWKGLLQTDTRDLPLIVYFHENQLAYPDREGSSRDLHFAFTNLTSALAADQVWFNSEFNRATMFAGLEELARRWPDSGPLRGLDVARGKSIVQYPGIAPGAGFPKRVSSGRIQLIWAARWEHDKNPEDLLLLLDGLTGAEVEFTVSVVGQRFGKSPACFAEIQRKYTDQIVNWGFQESRQDYLASLQGADVFVSTARHEFFGLATAEAIAAGCIPIVPNRLAYPELLDTDRVPERKCLTYDTIAGAIRTIGAMRHDDTCDRLTENLAEEIRTKFGWSRRAPEMDRAVAGLCRAKSAS